MEKKSENVIITNNSRAKIKVLGIGGGGGNAINNMINGGLDGVEFIAANTDFQVLDQNLAPTKIQLGVNLTKGLGAGGNPEIGSKSAQEDIEKIREAVDGSDMVFITAGLGGGTGTGGAPVVAQVCKEMGALTVAVVTKPFAFEGKVRHRNAEEGLKSLQEVVDTLITIPNNRLLCLADRRATFLEMFKRADDVLLYAVKGISDLITHPGYINVDFADLRTVMSEKGLALMGTGVGVGENRASQAAQQAISSPLLEDISIHGARAALINISTGQDLGMHEFEEVASLIHKEMDEDANIFLGMALDPAIGEEVRVTVIATGIGKMEKPLKQEAPTRAKRLPSEGIVPELNYDYLQIPTVVRHRPAREEAAVEEQQPRRRTFLQKLTGASRDEEDLSIPTFIRRQAD
ncbi:cell division protein FtsZ [Desulforhabdus amnigena]|jgi:cell division protein FtsZ|uniref:Cell division protein FtsZ n=1 Tax=Desulforhabdus amnigena TaxID=40218 RepID=A0A9W6FWB0_9BACT|nr:cell division protein FtsZ [Desulforhabdus amnigena]NLJ26740.1 cell division protein FtsZ [Deltaproteobacteria bacterium]GLI36002.1 cell division protein FtsZ [Desulforhabdus amnigena]